MCASSVEYIELIIRARPKLCAAKWDEVLNFKRFNWQRKSEFKCHLLEDFIWQKRSEWIRKLFYLPLFCCLTTFIIFITIFLLLHVALVAHSLYERGLRYVLFKLR